MTEKITVSQLNYKIHALLENDMFLRSVLVEGEASGVKYYSSGHIYFTLKDENAAIDAVMWNSYANKLSFRLKDGDKVVITGKITTYEKNGKIQLSAIKMEQDGKGELFKKFLQMKEELSEMGYFDPMYKKPIPKYINNIGVVTSQTGSAIQDIIKIAKERNPGVRISVYPAQVQGKGAEFTIAKGIQILDPMGFDVIIVGRGGGSEEERWCFNEKVVADAIFNANTPIISAVGHQDHYSIADYVADLRAATPSDAAKYVYNIKDTIDMLKADESRMKNSLLLTYQRYKTLTQSMEHRLAILSPKSRLEALYQRSTDLYDDLNVNIQNKLADRKKALEMLGVKISYNHPRNVLQKRVDELKKAAIKLDGLSPAKKLASGFSYIQNESGQNIKSAKQLSVGEKLNIHLNEGSFAAKVEEIKG